MVDHDTILHRVILLLIYTFFLANMISVYLKRPHARLSPTTYTGPSGRLQLAISPERVETREEVYLFLLFL